MTLSTSANTVRHSVTMLGVPFPFPIPFFKSEHLVVSSLRSGVSTILTLGSDYTVSGAGSDVGGTVTVTSGIEVGDTLIIQRVVPVVQETDLRNQGEYLAETVEDAFDYLTMISQQLVWSIGRLMQFPGSDPETISTVLPPMAARSSKVLAFNASGDPVVSSLTLAQLEEQPALALESAALAQNSSVASEASAMDSAMSAMEAAASASAAAQSAASVDGRAGRFFGEMVMLPNRNSSPNGVIKADGQLISNALAQYPAVVADLQSANPSVPVVTPAVWLSDPTKRLCWAYDSVANQIRVPDWNGMSSGSLGPAFFRGDGSLGFAPGTLRQDQIQNITGVTQLPAGGGTLTGAFKAGSARTVALTAQSGPGYDLLFDASRIARTGTETFPTHGVGVWGVVLFGTVSNPGAADAAALATSYANQQGQLTTLDTSLGFTYVYPNGGTEAVPGTAAINARYSVPNPFPGHPVICECQLLVGGVWFDNGFSAYTGSNSCGTQAGLRTGDDTIVVETGINYLLAVNKIHYSAIATRADIAEATPIRVKVWRVKG